MKRQRGSENQRRAIGRLRWLVVGLLVVTMVGAWAHGQFVLSKKEYLSAIELTRGPVVRRAFREVVKPAAASTVRILCDDKDAAMGIVVSADGEVVTKASQLRGRIVCRFADGNTYAAKIINVHPQHDLAMLKIDAKALGEKKLTPIPWGDARDLQLGDWVATPGLMKDPIAVGVKSVNDREIPARSGVLGIAMENQRRGGVLVKQVFPDSGAAAAGIEVGDVITAVNGRPALDQRALTKGVKSMKAGETIKLRVLRDNRILKVEATLTGRVQGVITSRSDMMNRMGGELSQRSTGFPIVFQHDTVLDPTDCGGPLLDLNGKCVGINIARAGRTESYAIPSLEVIKTIAAFRAGRYRVK